MAEAYAYLGPEGSNSEIAALYFSQDKAQNIACKGILSVFDALNTSNCDAAVLPIENSTEGPVTQVLDTWLNFENFYINEAYLMPIAYHLYASKTQALNQIKRIVSHPQCFAQTQNFIYKNCPQASFIPSVSSGKALEDLLEDPDPYTAVIANTNLAKTKPLTVLAKNIETQADNCTLFGLISKEWQPKKSHTNISFAFSASRQVPGSLNKVLSFFSAKDINLTRIVSRPSKKSFGEYIFFVDIELCPTTETAQMLFKEIKEVTTFQKILGSYTL